MLVSTNIPPRSTLEFATDWPRARLKALRTRGDPLADAVVSDLQATNGLVNIRDLLGVVRERAAAPDSNPAYQRFLDDVNGVPSWVDKQLLDEGSHVQSEYLLIMYPSLLAGSLVGGAIFKVSKWRVCDEIVFVDDQQQQQKQAMVVGLAGSMAANPSQRVSETSVMIARLALGVNAILPGGSDNFWMCIVICAMHPLNNSGNAHEILVRVRLLHAGLRHWLPASGKYHSTNGEVPVNQHDLGITLALFAYLNIRSLTMLGVQLTEREVAAYMSLWRYAGHVLGIAEELLFESFGKQEEFFLSSCIDEADSTSMWAQHAKGSYSLL
jgi:hypothetical protein